MMVASHVASGALAVGALVVGALASGVAIGAVRRRAGLVVAAVLLAGIACGAAVSAAAARAAVGGLAHAMLYAGLLWLFGGSLRPGRTAIVTTLARRTNKRFRAAMVPYTRKVTLAWALFAGFQLAASAALLALGWWRGWGWLIGPGQAVMAVALAIGEFGVRARRFPGEHTGFVETWRGVRNNPW